MKLQVKQIGHQAYFEGTTESGHQMRLHSTLSDDEEKKAASPMESLLMSVAGCSSVDVVMILEKMKQPLRGLSIDVHGERVEIGDAKPFRSIQLHFNLEGDLDGKKARRAVQLSVEKYCSVIESLHPDCQVDWEVSILN